MWFILSRQYKCVPPINKQKQKTTNQPTNQPNKQTNKKKTTLPHLPLKTAKTKNLGLSATLLSEFSVGRKVAKNVGNINQTLNTHVLQRTEDIEWTGLRNYYVHLCNGYHFFKHLNNFLEEMVFSDQAVDQNIFEEFQD